MTTTLQELQTANQETERLQQAHVLAQAGVCLDAFLLVSLYPNDERLSALRRSVENEQSTKAQLFDHIAALSSLMNRINKAGA